jgi:hypothetical protein
LVNGERRQGVDLSVGDPAQWVGDNGDASLSQLKGDRRLAGQAFERFGQRRS